MTLLAPNPGFNWQQVSWGGPDEPQAETCSYCDAPIEEDSVPLMIWNADGWGAQFCDDCQERWWGMETLSDEPEEDDHAEGGGEGLDLGPCCICESNAKAGAMVMLEVKNTIPGHGWGCVVCNLPADGASAVLCDDCATKWQAGEAKLRFACCGYPADEGRVPIGQLTIPHAHDPNVDHG